jgi:hypothetical protein
VARVFLLSPANASGERAAVLLRDAAAFPLAREIRVPAGAPLGEVFSFLSGLYFRGKLAYARAFGEASLVITPDRGLVAPDLSVHVDDLRAMARVPIDLREPRYRLPLERDAAALARRLGWDEVVLLGSVASAKYTEVLLSAFGERLLFPVDFVGRGDMSRGGLLLRAVRAGTELPYVPVAGAVVRGKRPPRLPPLPRNRNREGEGPWRR